jgi:DNA-binding NarL/FixJ family response regulator
MPIRVYLIDDQSLVRVGLRALLGGVPDVTVVGAGADPRTACTELPVLRPDVVLLDITMPELSGIDAIPQIRKAWGNARILMMSHHEGEAFVERALRAGADGYLSKDSEPQELDLALRTVLAGRPYVSPKVQGGLVTRLRAEQPHAEYVAGALQALSEREREVFQLLALGRSNKEIARELEITPATVKKHRENLQRKLDVHSTAEITRLAVREGLLDA